MREVDGEEERRCGEEDDRRWRRWIRLGQGSVEGGREANVDGVDDQRRRRSDSPEMEVEVERGDGEDGPWRGMIGGDGGAAFWRRRRRWRRPEA